jgi:hypothetical protein
VKIARRCRSPSSPLRLPGNCKNCKVPHNSRLFTIAQLSKLKQKLSSAHLVSAVDRFVGVASAGGSSNGATSTLLSIRVPAERFDEFRVQFRKLSLRVESDSIDPKTSPNNMATGKHAGARSATVGRTALCGKRRRPLPAGGGIASFRRSITHSAYPLATLGCVPRGSGARLEAERMAPRSPQEGEIDFCISYTSKVDHLVAAHL